VVQAARGTYIAYSTSPGEVALDGRGRNSIYTKYLLRHIIQPGLQVEELFKRVRNGVVRETQEKQVPWESSSLLGEFSFAK
jgi:uncharacterized caspase-like protein